MFPGPQILFLLLFLILKWKKGKSGRRGTRRLISNSVSRMTEMCSHWHRESMGGFGEAVLVELELER